MPNLNSSLYNIRYIDDLGQKKTFINEINPLAKLLTTISYLIMVISFERYEVTRLLPFVFYPVIIFTMAEIPFVPIFKRVLVAMPLIIGIGILNPLFDDNTISFVGITISRGWITFLSISIKCILTVMASILLIATTGMDRLAAALRILKIPKIFVLQLLLTYRYIYVLMEEISRMQRAYSLRAPSQKGINIKVWGSFAGQAMLRTFDRAQRIYQAMNLRGFSGEYNTGDISKLSLKDSAYFAVWSAFFIIARIYNIPMLIGLFVTGVIK